MYCFHKKTIQFKMADIDESIDFESVDSVCNTDANCDLSDQKLQDQTHPAYEWDKLPTENPIRITKSEYFNWAKYEESKTETDWYEEKYKTNKIFDPITKEYVYEDDETQDDEMSFDENFNLKSNKNGASSKTTWYDTDVSQQEIHDIVYDLQNKIENINMNMDNLTELIEENHKTTITVIKTMYKKIMKKLDDIEKSNEMRDINLL